MSTDTARSNSQGEVSVILRSGNLPGPVRVKAEVVDSDPLIAAVSQELRVGTGLPDKNSFDISFSELNPQAWRYNGVVVGINVYAADHFNNPVPDGTAISLVTEGGAVGANCLTEDGVCNVEWISQDPRPQDGRVTLMAFVEGEESFNDANGNGFYDQGEWDGVDEHEAYVDANESGQFEAGEAFIDRSQNGQWGGGDGHYNGLLCQGDPLDSGDCSRELVDVSTWGTIVMSGRAPSAYFCHYDAADADGDGLNWFDCWNDATQQTWVAADLTGLSVAVACVVDIAANGTLNPVPYGTEISFVASGEVATVGQDSFTHRSTNAAIYHIDEDGVVRTDNRSSCGGGRYGVGLTVGAAGGSISVEAEIPDGNFSTDSVSVAP